MPHNFASVRPADSTVFGACRPGYPGDDISETAVDEWIEAMNQHGIERVCCLLAESQLDYYDNLLTRYRQAFGSERVCHAPVPDYTQVPQELLRGTIFPFLRDAEAAGERVVVHCSAGKGRTGQVLAFWLTTEHGVELTEAIDIVSKRGRDPTEAVSHQQLTEVADTLSGN